MGSVHDSAAGDDRRHPKYDPIRRRQSLAASRGEGKPKIFEWMLLIVRRCRPKLSVHETWRDVPNVGGVFGDGAIAGEPSGSGHIENGFTGPRVRIGVQLADALMSIGVRRQI